MKFSMKVLTITLAAALLLGPVPSALAAPSHGNIGGRIFGQDLVSPAEGLTVQAIPDGAKAPVASTRTDKRGSFELSRLPAGAYIILFSNAKGEPVAATRVAAKAGEAQTLTLAVPDRKPGEAATAPGQSEKWINTPQGATTVVVVAAILLALGAKQLVDDDDVPQEPVSPSAPPV